MLYSKIKNSKYLTSVFESFYIKMRQGLCAEFMKKGKNYKYSLIRFRFIQKVKFKIKLIQSILH